MIIPDKKKAVTTILSRMGKPNVEAKPEESFGDDNDKGPALQAIAEDILGAIQAKSVTDLAQALKSFCMYCDEDDFDQEG